MLQKWVPNRSASDRASRMTRITTLTSPFLLGFDEIERTLDRITKSASDGYPPYNIERIPASGQAPESIRITLAVAGFTREQLDVTIEDKQLVIRGRQTDERERIFHATYLLSNIIDRSLRQKTSLIIETIHISKTVWLKYQFF
jgi:HSP20 family molecular chaperone IbpA